MNKTKAMPSHKRVLELLSYDSSTGIFTWKKTRAGVRSLIAGNKRKDGYIIITIDYQRILAHRLAIFFETMEWPVGVVDHIDGNTSNNSFVNLRQVSQQINAQNIKKATSKNKSSKFLGVSYHKRDNLWRARIYCNGKTKCWYFKNIDHAKEKYLEEKRKLHLGCTI